MKKHIQNYGRLISGSFLVGGTMIGAGMLGMPLVTGRAGFIPGFLATLIVWIFMYTTGRLFLRVVLHMPSGANLFSISQFYFGSWLKWLNGGMFLFLYYALLVAYFAAGALILDRCFSTFLLHANIKIAAVCFALFFFVLLNLRIRSVDFMNKVFTCGMLIAWISLIYCSIQQIKIERLVTVEWRKITYSFPILMSAFGFHNIIPSLSDYLNREEKKLKQTIFYGTLGSFFIYSIWQLTIIGSIPTARFEQGWATNLSVAGLLEKFVSSRPFFIWAEFFAFFAIATSIIGVGYSMIDFFGDACGINHRIGWKRVYLCLLTMIPPLFLTLWYPNLFIKALGVAGGIGEVFLNALLPIFFAWTLEKKQKNCLSKKAILIGLVLLSLGITAIELLILKH